MDLDAIQQIFFQECEEGLAAMEVAFAAMRAGDVDPETINGVFRCVHSIKGGAGAFGHERLQAYTHQYETLLDLLRSGALAFSPSLLDLIVAAYDLLSDHVGAARDAEPAPNDAAMVARLQGAATGDDRTMASSPAPTPATAAPAAESNDDFDDLMAMLDDVETAPDDASAADVGVAAMDWRLCVRPGPRAFDHGAEPLLLLRELARMGAERVVCDLDELPPLADLAPDVPCLGWTLWLPGSLPEDEILGVFDFADGYALALERVSADDAPAAAAHAAVVESATALDVPAAVAAPVSAAAAAAAPLTKPIAAGSQSIRVDLDRLDRLVNLVGELVITQAMLAQRLTENGLAAITELSDLDHLTRELQESTMSIRAQPMKTVFSRVPRIIRELEGETGKRVRLETDGEMTEVDKTVVERIGEPLTHLIRNAVDHGIENPADREAAGKPVEGLVRLSAMQQSGRIVITVADDGRGIDRTKVRAKAIERGIIAADAVLGDEDVDNLIFAPGFSTAAVVTNVSGRGVGMDVVRRNVQALGGRISIQSRLGEGSRFSLSLPLTLAVVDGMIVTVGGQTFVIPLSQIVESLRPRADAVTGLGCGASVLDVRGAYVPILAVGEQLAIAGSQADPTEAVLIVVECDGGPVALLVDSIQDQRQVVVKSLETNFQAIAGVAGATILGNGRVALILDVEALVLQRSRRTRASVSPLSRAA